MEVPDELRIGIQQGNRVRAVGGAPLRSAGVSGEGFRRTNGSGRRTVRDGDALPSQRVSIVARQPTDG